MGAEPNHCHNLDRKLVVHCTPTLAGLKPASLFIYLDKSSDIYPISCRINKSTYEKDFALTLCRVRHMLKPYGVMVEALARRKTGVMLYVFRPEMLIECLKDIRTRQYLRKVGYHVESLRDCIALLRRRILASDRKTIRDDTCSFPHEIGFFLGYPYEDVVGFIENNGRNHLDCGCWKIYSNERDAKECFCRYKNCTRIFKTLFDGGTSLEELVKMGNETLRQRIDEAV